MRCVEPQQFMTMTMTILTGKANPARVKDVVKTIRRPCGAVRDTMIVIMILLYCGRIPAYVFRRHDDGATFLHTGPRMEKYRLLFVLCFY